MNYFLVFLFILFIVIVVGIVDCALLWLAFGLFYNVIGIKDKDIDSAIILVEIIIVVFLSTVLLKYIADITLFREDLKNERKD